jgi:hypothetical protein
MTFEYELTPSQKELCAELERRDLWFLSEDAKSYWKRGSSFYFDARQGKVNGLKRKLEACNKQMLQIWALYLSSAEYGIESWQVGNKTQAKGILANYTHREIREAAIEFGGYSTEEAEAIADAVKDGN